jgi:hypothetical protein
MPTLLFFGLEVVALVLDILFILLYVFCYKRIKSVFWKEMVVNLTAFVFLTMVIWPFALSGATTWLQAMMIAGILGLCSFSSLARLFLKKVPWSRLAEIVFGKAFQTVA